MPTASLSADITVGAPSAGSYPVTYTITGQAEFGETDVLVLRASDDELDRVATLFDLGDLPVGATVGEEYYRASTATVNYSDVNKAVSGVQSFKDSLQSLVIQYAAFRGDLETESVTYQEDF